MMGFPNRVDAAALSGGSWTTGLPLSNLQDRTLARVARTTDAALTSTTFDVDHGASKSVRVLALANHNLSTYARIRVRGSNDATFATSVTDTGWVDVWPVVYAYGLLEWEDDNWWSGKYGADELQGYRWTRVIVLPSLVALRYWRVEIDDQRNASNYVQIGRLFIGPVWQPKLNMSYGASIGWETTREAQPALGGAEYFADGVEYRVTKFSLDCMDQDEAFSRAFEIQRQASIDKEVLWIQNSGDTNHALRRQFLARLRSLSAIEYPYYQINKAAFELKELI